MPTPSHLLRPLKPDELAVLQLLERGKTIQEMTHELDWSPYQVKANMRRLYAKLGAATSHDALRRAEELGMFEQRGQEL